MHAHNNHLSLAKDKIRILLLEGINDSAVELIKGAGYSSTTRLMTALDGDALDEAIRNAHIIGIRSRTQLTDEVFAHADRLIAVGCFSVGTNQVDLDAGRVRGIPVFNAPYSNTRSVAELVIGEIVMLLRRIIPRSVSAHVGGRAGISWRRGASASIPIRRCARSPSAASVATLRVSGKTAATSSCRREP
jgi:D-3-phosphoglycerate dehydrogenase